MKIPDITNIRLIAMDLDGTLLDTQYRISPANHHALRDLHASGIKVVLATGRRFGVGAHFSEAVGIHEAAIFQNGAVIKEIAGRWLIYRQGISTSLAHRVFCAGKEAGFSPIIICNPSGPGQIFLEETRIERNRLERYLMKSWNDVTVLRRLDMNALKDLLQLMFCGSVNKIRRLADLFKELFDGDVKILLTEYPERDMSILDVMHRNVSKGHALKIVADIYGFPMSQVLAIGDNLNDKDMLERAGMAMVMGNASPELKDSFGLVLPTCNESGVAWGIWRHVLKRTDRLDQWFGNSWNSDAESDPEHGRVKSTMKKG